MRVLVAIVGACLFAGQANAAIVTRGFSLTASNFVNFAGETAPFALLTANFRLTYDDSASGFMGAPDNFTAITAGMVNAGPFSATPNFGYFPASAISPFPRLVVGGALNGTNVQVNGTNDFFFSFDASAAGATTAMLSFTSTDRNLPFIATNALVSPTVSAVPEPTVWALMIAGFALIGSTLRRRVRGLRRANIAA